MPLREEWLGRAAVQLTPLIGAAGWPMPSQVRYSCGWPMGSRGKSIGQCWSAHCSKDGTFEIFISPVLDDPLRVLDVQLHEMIHAAVGLECKHRGAFKRCAIACGLEGPMTATTASAALVPKLKLIADAIGPYPHAELRQGLSNAPKKQAARMLKVKCPDCTYTVRVARKWLEIGVPQCPCGDQMSEA